MHFCQRLPQSGRRTPAGTVVGLKKADCTLTPLNGDTVPESWLWAWTMPVIPQTVIRAISFLQYPVKRWSTVLLGVTVHVKHL